MNDECQDFWNMIASKLINYNDTVRFVIQNEIMSIFFNANMGFYELCHHTHLHTNNPPQAHFQIDQSKLYPKSINPHPHNSLSSLRSQILSPSPLSQYINSLLSQSFPTESTSPATTSSEKDINTQVLLE